MAKKTDPVPLPCFFLSPVNGEVCFGVPPEGATQIDMTNSEPFRDRRLDSSAMQEVMKRHKAWWWSEQGGVRANLDGANLDGANLDGANLVRANLDGANLVRANLDGANLVRANLDGANLVRANLDGANLDGANLVRANLDGANLVRANLDGANLDGANLVRANLDGANLVRANLVRANLDGANLDGANLVRANLDGANLVRANLDGANLVRANLDGANLDGANLDGANLDGANLDGANLVRANLDGANLYGAKLPSPTALLLVSWGIVSDDLTADLMRFDAASHPDPTAFDRWAAGGACPYAEVHVARAANFQENRKLWQPGPLARPYDLMQRLLAEKCPTWDEAKAAKFKARFDAMVKEMAERIKSTEEKK